MLDNKNTKRILITGGSGFIGTNLVESFLANGEQILSIDIRQPQNKAHERVFEKVDLLDSGSLKETFLRFRPTQVVHLAARTDLQEKKNLGGYSSNTKGVENLIEAISSQPSVERCIFTSTKLIAPTDYVPQADDDYHPNTLYGESKMIGELAIKNSNALHCVWCIVRPTSIWGPWSLSAYMPYGRFFVMIARGLYFHPGRLNPPKSFGYVGNVVFQIKKILSADRDKIHKQIFYLSDYQSFTIKEWADLISLKLRNKKNPALPDPIVSVVAWLGDLLKICGVSNPPLTSFRLRNMRADTSNVLLQSTQAITGPLPYSLDRGIEETIAWMKECRIIR